MILIVNFIINQLKQIKTKHEKLFRKNNDYDLLIPIDIILKDQPKRSGNFTSYKKL